MRSNGCKGVAEGTVKATSFELRAIDAYDVPCLVGGMFRAAMLLGSIATVAVSQQLEYPKAKKGDLVDDYFGTKITDPYRWLEDTDSVETADWVKAENVLTSGYMESPGPRFVP